MISDTIRQRLEERFSSELPEFYKRRIIFWLDTTKEFADGIDELELPGVKTLKLTGSNNFEVKKLLSTDDLTSNYLIYDPLSYAKDQHDDWLLDIKLYSEEFRADLVSLQMEELNIEPSLAMQKTVKLYPKFFDNKERKTKLKKFEQRYQSPLQLHIDIISVLCGLSAGSTEDIIIKLLSSGLEKEHNEILINIEKFGNTKAFWELIKKYTGYEDLPDRSLSELASHLLISALSQKLPLSTLQGLERFISESSKAYCYQLVHKWQHSDNKKDLEELCYDIGNELRLQDRFNKIDILTLLKSDIFPSMNDTILKRYFSEIAEGIIKTEDIIKTVENRRTSVWYSLTKNYFEGLYYIAKMQEFYLSHTTDFHIVEAEKIWNMYTNSAYEMDRYYRHFHLHFGCTLKNASVYLGDALKECIDVVEGLYCEWFLKQLTFSWTKAIAKDLEFSGYIKEISEQKKFYNHYVSPSLKKGSRVFVVISDALRYEVAAELSETLSLTTKGKSTLESVQAIFPTITKFGMAALLPGKTISTNEKLEVLVDNMPTISTTQREAVLKATNQNSIALSSNDLMKMNQEEKRDLIAGKEVVYIYHNIIDAMGDKANTENKVFEACDDAISEIISIVKTITNDLSGTNLYITADHGFLYTYKALEENQKISRQTFIGDFFELGRRYALVDSETKADYLLPVNTEKTMAGKTMHAYTPQDIVRIKVQGGGENYVHGGISLQEMVVPVIVYKGMRSGYKNYIEIQNPGLSLISESRKISNLTFSLDFLQKQAVGDKVQPCNYNLYFTDEAGIPVSDTQVLIADRINTNDSDRVFRLQFSLKSMRYNRTDIYRLKITNEVDTPEEIEFQIDIPFADDFGFDL